MRRVMHGLALGLVSFCLASSAAPLPDVSLASIQAKLEHAPVIRGQFQQEKMLQGFRKPLVSQGRFTVAKDLGVLWETQTPLSQTLVLKRAAIIARQGDQTTMELHADQEPSVRSINRLLFALLSGDFNVLSETFSVATGGNASHWTMHLESRDANLKAVIRDIELEGDSFVRGVLLHEANGDVTRITLSDQTLQQAPSESERRSLAP